MKLNKLFLGAIAALASAAMVACSDDAPDINNGGENGDGETGYLTVNLVNPSSTDSRATGDFVNGTGAESVVNNVLFLLFDTDGTQAVEPIEWTPTWEDDATLPEGHEKITTAHLVINGDKGKKYPTRLICIANPTSAIKTAVKDKKLSQVLDEIGAMPYGVYDGDNNSNINGTVSNGNFIMTNSVYINNGRKVVATIIENKVYDTSDAAKSDPVTVHIERIVAKVETKLGENFSNNGTTETIDGVDTKLVPHIQGIEVANIAQKSYLFKDLSISYPSLTTNTTAPWWNAPALFRSYWENTPVAKNQSFFNQNFTAISRDWKTDQSFYIQPNTSNTKTSVLITAILKKENADESAPGVDLVQFAGGYFTVSGYHGQLTNALNGAGYRIKSDGTDGSATYSNLKPEDVFTESSWAWNTSVAGLEEYEACIQLSSLPNNLYILTGTDEQGNNTYEKVDATTALADINGKLSSKAYKAQYWKEGRCYYYTEIKHHDLPGTEGKTTPLNGVVRNHIYRLTLSGVVGFGTPVPDASETIHPQKPTDTNTYLAAEIHLLKWRVVEQNVNFGE